MDLNKQKFSQESRHVLQIPFTLSLYHCPQHPKYESVEAPEDACKPDWKTCPDWNRSDQQSSN